MFPFSLSKVASCLNMCNSQTLQRSIHLHDMSTILAQIDLVSKACNLLVCAVQSSGDPFEMFNSFFGGGGMGGGQRFKVNMGGGGGGGGGFEDVFGCKLLHASKLCLLW